ncbi:MAG: phytanoyl-CoA dioxygenase family protein [Candidatus Dormibacteria bacterium]
MAEAVVGRATVVGDELRQRFSRDGYFVVPSVLDGDLMAEVSAHVDWLQARHPELRGEQLGHLLVADDPFWVRLVSDPRLLDVAEAIIGPDIALFASHYISKPAYSGQPVLWHQDSAYWPLDPMEVVTLWLAVDDSDAENGCMRVIPGSHTMEVKPLRAAADGENVLGSEIAVETDTSKAVDVVVPRGGVSVHHPNIVHGSEPNRSPRRRCGLTIRYIPATTRILHDGWPCAFLLRGRAVPGINTYVARPRWRSGDHMPFRGCSEPLP